MFLKVIHKVNIKSNHQNNKMIRINHSGPVLPSKLFTLLFIAVSIIFLMTPTDSSSQAEKKISSTADGKGKQLTQQLNQLKQNPTPSTYPDRHRRALPRELDPPVPIPVDQISITSFVRISSNGELTYVFPSSTVKPINRSAETNTCLYTTSTQDYPTDIINEHVERYGERFKAAFGTDSINNSTDDELDNRAGELSQNLFCDNDIQIIRPTFGCTNQNTTVMVVNTDRFEQKLHLEICRKIREPNGAEMGCEQIYHNHTMVAFDINKNETYFANIKLPLYCRAWKKCG